MPKVVIFVDGSNFSTACNKAKMRPRFDKLASYFENTIGEVVGKFYFTALPEDQSSSPIRQFLDKLEYNGWMLETKLMKTIQTGDRVIYKGDMDVEITCKAFEMATHGISDIVLLSGDGDYVALVKAMATRGIRTTAVSYNERVGGMTADELRRAVHNFIDVRELRQYVELTSEPVEKPRLRFLRTTAKPPV